MRRVSTETDFDNDEVWVETTVLTFLTGVDTVAKKKNQFSEAIRTNFTNTLLDHYSIEQVVFQVNCLDDRFIYTLLGTLLQSDEAALSGLQALLGLGQH